MGQTFRVVGPPGTGKTTFLTHQIEAATKKHGKNSVVVASFTKTAAHELSSRTPGMTGVGTLHSHAYHAIGRPQKIADTMGAEFSAMFPRYKITSSARASSMDTGLDQVQSKAPGDELLAKMNLLRARMVDRKLWPSNVQSFEASWNKFKYDTGSVDFTDMIEHAIRDTVHAPGDPAVLFIDEAQDLAPLQHALAMRWGRRCESLVVAGDPDQTIFSFSGATPETMMGDVDSERVLAQSYRVSRAVHEYASGWVRKIKKRTDYAYKPTAMEGFVKKAPYTFKMAEELVTDVERYTADGKRVMILASCSYMLSPVIAELRQRGLLFHNPWRPSNGSWNPIHSYDEDDDRWSLTDRLLAFMAPCPEVWGENKHLWSEAEFAAWASIVRSDAGITKGMKKVLPDLTGDWTIDMNFVAEFFGIQTEFWEMFARFRKQDALKWIGKSLVLAKAKSATYPLKVISQNTAPLPQPLITVGTIHSVKGGEADVVIIAPDLSQSGVMEYTGNESQRDGVTRLFYVALTRAREGVVLCGQSAGNAIRWL